MKHNWLRSKITWLIVFPCLFLVIGLVTINYCFANPFAIIGNHIVYSFKHQPVNNANPIDKTRSTKYLHVNSYQLKSKATLYADSLLERYSYYAQGNSQYINAYVGSHGTISSEYDPIVPINRIHYYNRFIPLSTNYKYSDLVFNPQSINTYANISRILSLDCSAARETSTDLMKIKNKQIKAGFAILMDPLSTNQSEDCYMHNCAPNEVYGAAHSVSLKPNKHNYVFDKYLLKDDPYTNHTDKKKYWNYYYVFLFHSVWFDPYNNPPKTYSPNGKRVYLPNINHDLTKYYSDKFITSADYQRHYFNPHRVYSNGNSYFLSQMYRNYQSLKIDNKGVAHTNNYHVLDVYKKGLHLAPIMFNEFVRQSNKYQSPYQFNNVVRTTHGNVDKINQTNYNLPCNYDKNHYYYRTIDGLLVRDTDIKRVNNKVRPLIMGDIHDKHVLPTNKKQKRYYQTKLEYYFAKTIHDLYMASQFLNYQRADNGLEPLWMIGLIDNNKIGTYHPGEILCFKDRLTSKKVSHYYIVQHSVKKYIPVYKMNGYDCFKATCTFKGKTRQYVRAKDSYLLMGCKVHYN